MRQSTARLVFIAAGLLLMQSACQDKPQTGAKPEINEIATSAEDIGKQFRKLIYIKQADYAQAFKLINAESDVRPYKQGLAFVGRDPHQYFGNKLKSPRRCEVEVLEQLSDDTIEKITKLARDHRIVIVNEAHDQARDRAFISKLALALRAEGYTLYAAETFSTRKLAQDEWQTGIMKRGFPINHDGYYSNEPVYGQLLQNILELGYTPVAYETTLPFDKTLTRAERIASRETEQMNNLIEHALNKFPDQKILVHVGYSHALEIPDRQGNMWMAQRLKAKTDIDPLTIAQTRTKGSCLTSGDDTTNALDYKYFIPDPSLEDADIPYHGFDIQLFPGQMRFTKGRPHWLKDMGRNFVDIQTHLNIADKWVVVEARVVNEPAIDSANHQYGKGARSIPHDRVLVRPGEDIALALVPGVYVLTAYGINNTIVDTTKITVE